MNNFWNGTTKLGKLGGQAVVFREVSIRDYILFGDDTTKNMVQGRAPYAEVTKDQKGEKLRG